MTPLLVATGGMIPCRSPLKIATGGFIGACGDVVVPEVDLELPGGSSRRAYVPRETAERERIARHNRLIMLLAQSIFQIID